MWFCTPSSALFYSSCFCMFNLRVFWSQQSPCQRVHDSKQSHVTQWDIIFYFFIFILFWHFYYSLKYLFLFLSFCSLRLPPNFATSTISSFSLWRSRRRCDRFPLVCVDGLRFLVFVASRACRRSTSVSFKLYFKYFTAVSLLQHTDINVRTSRDGNRGDASASVLLHSASALLGTPGGHVWTKML